MGPQTGGDGFLDPLLDLFASGAFDRRGAWIFAGGDETAARFRFNSINESAEDGFEVHGFEWIVQK